MATKTKRVCVSGYGSRLVGKNWRTARSGSVVRVSGCGKLLGTRKLDGYRVAIVSIKGRRLAIFGVPGIANR